MIKPAWLKIPEEDYPDWVLGVAVSLAGILVIGLWMREALAALPFVAMVGSLQQSSREQRFDGALVWSPPKTMRFGQRECIEVNLGNARAAVEELIADFKSANPQVVLERRLAPGMTVKLIGEPDFEIVERSTPDQYIELGEIGQWDFYVTPKKRGQLTLRLRPSIRFQIDGSEQGKDLEPYDHFVTVPASPLVVVGDLYKKHRKFVVTALLVPFLLWFADSAGWTDRAAEQVRSRFG